MEQRGQKFQRRQKLMDERAASLPLQKFETQRDEETRRIWNTNPRTDWMSKIPIGGTKEKEATETIKKRCAETDTEAESPPPAFSIFGVPQKHPQPKPRRPKSNDEKQQVAERRAVREREREASRPYHQFVKRKPLTILCLF
jgi:hypothetical protein